MLHAVHLHRGHADRRQSSILSPVHCPFVAVSGSKVDWILRTHFFFYQVFIRSSLGTGKDYFVGVTALQHMHQYTLSPVVRTTGLNALWLFYCFIID